MTSDDIIDALEKRYAPPEWATLLEVYDKTSTAGKRRADMVAINCFRSRGWEIHGIEIKVSTGDLSKEIRNAEKAEEVGKYCDRWYVAIPSALKKHAPSVPAAWGVITVTEKGSTRIIRQAEKIEPVPISRGFMAAVMRRAAERLVLFRQFEAKARDADKMRSEGFEAGQKLRNDLFEIERGEHKRVLEEVARFEKASGLRITRSWDLEEIGTTVRALMPYLRNRNFDSIRNMLSRQIARLQEGLSAIERAEELCPKA